MTPKSVSYKKLQTSGLVRAATVAAFTRLNVRQLVVFKESTLEVWEIEKEMPVMIASADLWLLVCNCEVLENPTRIASSMSTGLDRIVVIDDEGKVFVLEWSILSVREVAINIITVDGEKLEALVDHSRISKPFVLGKDTPMTSIMELSRIDAAGAKDRIKKIQGVTLVAMAIYQNLIQVLLTAWVPTTRCNEANVEESSSLRPVVNEYLLYLQNDAVINLTSQLRRTPTVLDLTFIEGLDFRGHPLLVVLSAHDGLLYNLVNIQSYSIDLAHSQIRSGPWKLSNLHPTARFLLPWFGDDIKRSCEWSSEGDYKETGIRQGHGVLVISSKELLFVESSGYRTSLPISLSGMPTCCEVLRQSSLVVGDSSGTLCVLDLKQWERHDLQPIKIFAPFPPIQILKQVQFLRVENGEMSQTGFVIFLSGYTSPSKLLAVLPDLTGISKLPSSKSCNFERDTTELDAPPPSEEGVSWYTKEYSVEDSSLDEPTSVHSMILVDDPCNTAQKQILVICGRSPTATLRRGSLGVAFNTDKIYSEKIGGLPQILPVRWTFQSPYHTHLLLSYPVEGMTDILSLCDEDKNSALIEGIEREQSTLATGIIAGDWLIQVTTRSLRVLSATPPRVLVAEWQPNDCHPRGSHLGGQKHQNIIHASVGPVGVVLSNGRTVFSMKMDKSGRLCTPETSTRPFEVSALGISEYWIFGDRNIKPRSRVYAKYFTTPRPVFHNSDLYFLVVVAHWSANTVHLLTWPELEEITHVKTGCCPIRSVCVTSIGKEQYLIVGTAEGTILHFQIKYDIGNAEEMPVSEKSPAHDNHGGEVLGCLKLKRGLGTSTTRTEPNNLKSLKNFCLRLVNGRVVKLGRSILSIIPGPFCGPELDPHKKLTRILEKQDSVIIQTDHNSIVMISGEDGELQAMSVSGYFSRPLVTSFRIHTESTPNSLAMLSSEKQLIFGHVDLSVKLRWCKIDLVGNPQQVVYHRGTGCAVITLNDFGSLKLSIVHVQSMRQVLNFEVGCDQLSTALEVLDLPVVEEKDGQKNRDCIILASQRNTKGKFRGTIQFYDLSCTYTDDMELAYELRLLGKHYTELPCHSICLLRKQEEFIQADCCEICNVESCIEGFEPLHTTLKHLAYCGGHWNDYCRDQESKKALHQERQVLLVLGYHGRVELFAVVIRSSLTSIILARPLAEIMKSALPSLSDSVNKLDYDIHITQRRTDEDREKGQPSEGSTRSSHTVMSNDSLVCLSSLSIFDTPGKGCVSALIGLSSNILLVGEMFHGIGLFSVEGNSDLVHLAWHPMSQPITAILQLEMNFFAVALYEQGLQLIERDLLAEGTFQEERRLRNEDGETLFQRNVSWTSELRRSIDSVNLVEANSERSELPSFKLIGNCPYPVAGMQMQLGRLGIQSEPFDTKEVDNQQNKLLLTVISYTGEVSEVQITSILDSEHHQSDDGVTK